jgi:hypothetical protein
MNVEIADAFRIADPEPLETYELLDCTDIDTLNEYFIRARMPD